MTVKHKKSPFFFSMSHLLSAPITHPNRYSLGMVDGTVSPMAPCLGSGR